MGQALYRKYRSKSLSEIIGQDHITKTLENALKKGAISHAYLLTGPRGVGKTSIARILAHEINGLTYNDEAHLDIIEIDAASNRRIDEIRDLRERVNTAPSAAKYKVYIIDEVHMLTKEAFNALLKTLEEPPAHVVFILATTESHKLPETIVSRTQRFSFRPVPENQVVSHLRDISTKESVDIDDGALQLIAKHGEGSFRDSISLLDQASNHDGKITKEVIEQMLGLAPTLLISRLLEDISTGDPEATVEALQNLYAQGFEAATIATQIAENIRNQLFKSQLIFDIAASLQLLRDLIDIAASRDPKRLLEVTLLNIVFLRTKSQASISIDEKEATPNLDVTPKIEKSVEPEPLNKKTIGPKKEKKIKSNDAVADAVDKKPIAESDINNLWEKTLSQIKKKYNTLYGIARMAQPTIEGNVLTLRFGFSFHQKRCNEAKNRDIIVSTLSEITGQVFQVHCIVDTSVSLEQSAVPIASTVPEESEGISPVSTISNIFGGAELLES